MRSTRRLQTDFLSETEWWGESGFGSDNYRDAQADGRYWQQVDTGRNQKGLAFWMQTNSNGKTSARWFDIGGRRESRRHGDGSSGAFLLAAGCVWRVVPVQLSHDTTETVTAIHRLSVWRCSMSMKTAGFGF